MHNLYFLILPLETEIDSDSIAYAPLLLCLAGFIYFGFYFMHYRNTDKRHHHETETTANTQNMREYNTLVEHRRRLRTSSMEGRNDNFVEGAVASSNKLLSTLGEFSDVGKILGK